MLNNIYGYIFGSDDSNSSSDASFDEPEQEPCTINGKLCEDDWFLVGNGYADDRNRGVFSPVLIPTPELRDIDELSFCSARHSGETTPPTADQIRRAEALRLAKARNAQRAHLEKMLFEDTQSSGSLSTSVYKKGSGSKGVQRVAQVTDGIKGKSRSKKSSGKLASGRNNDRKVNNII
ncbi:unnamed protein product [Caenorhabditis bovis]|uniref:Uncharacterized protein n=1 Tax=Caenorhabditis bovis TaxID=2654633 RepID=A0A8S1F7F8_9PELO|nr:unnamed protein product [Caenorhabditis bovis]